MNAATTLTTSQKKPVDWIAIAARFVSRVYGLRRLAVCDRYVIYRVFSLLYDEQDKSAPINAYERKWRVAELEKHIRTNAVMAYMYIKCIYMNKFKRMHNVHVSNAWSFD